MENRDNLRSNSLTSFALVQERVDCKMTPWEYTACNTTCGQGFRWKFRSIAVNIFMTLYIHNFHVNFFRFIHKTVASRVRDMTGNSKSVRLLIVMCYRELNMLTTIQLE